MKTLYNPRPDLWPQVTLKGFFALVALVSVLLAWASLQIQWIRDRHEALHWVESINIRPGPDAEWGDGDLLRQGPIYAPWPLYLVGEPGVDVVRILKDRVEESDHIHEQVPQLKKLFPESRISVR
jgi:hypothetical protein